jgi:hypothetical protein
MRTAPFLPALALAALAAAPAARAQDIPLEIDPNDSVPRIGDEPEDYPPPATTPQPVTGEGQPAPGGVRGAPADDPSTRYYLDEGAGPEEPAADLVPELHVVRSGDTLWDLCGYYFRDPWRWPKIWSYNPTITNPHWIYPGDVVRLLPQGEAPIPTMINRVDTSPRMAFDDPERRTGAELRQLAFLEAKDLKLSGTIVGSVEDKLMLTVGDEIFIDYPSGKPPQVSKRYAIYTPIEDVKHPDGKAKIGAYVRLQGEVQILEVKKDKKARGVITYVTGVVERGHNVGPVKTQFRSVEPVVADRNLEGVIVAVIDVDELIGEVMIVFVDRGKKDGVVVGNRFQVVRRGDAYAEDHEIERGGRDDRRYPDETVGEIIVVEVGTETSIGLVTTSFKEAFIGDHVVMRKGK